MNRLALSLYTVLVLFDGCDAQRMATASKPDAQNPPFSISIVPETNHVQPFGGSIAMAREKARTFHVVISNVSSETQAVWEDSNSWGYQNVSFELVTENGKKILLSKRQAEFTTNFPSTFLIEPRENQVYDIRLDEEWKAQPTLAKSDEMAITLKAIYEVPPTPEAAEYKVWTGRVESRSYKFKLRQW
jgi:hypothetical protein